MSEILNTHYFKSNFAQPIRAPLSSLAVPLAGKANPASTLIPGYAFWNDNSDISSLVLAYVTFGSVVATGLAGTNSFDLTNGTINGIVYPGGKFMVSSEIYTVATVVGATVTTVETILTDHFGDHVLLNECSQINDKSGNGYNMVAATQGCYNTNQINGLGALGVNSTTGGHYTVPAGLLTALSNTACTIFSVQQSKGSTTRQTVLQLKAATAPTITLELNGNGGANTAGFVCGAAITAEVSYSPVTPNNTNIITCTRSGTTQGIQVNNGVASTNSSAVNATYTSGLYGSRTTSTVGFNGLLCELVIYTSLLTSKQIAQNLRYFNKKWPAY